MIRTQSAANNQDVRSGRALHAERLHLGLLHLGIGADQTEGGVDPAVSVHRIPGNLLHNAVNGVPDVLPTGHQQACSHQDHEGGLDTGFRSNYLDE